MVSSDDDSFGRLVVRHVDAEADAEAIARIYNYFVESTTVSFEVEALSAADMCRRIGQIAAHYPYLVCEADGCIAGYAYVHAWNPRAAYASSVETSIYVSHHLCGRGIGRLLLRSLEEECRRRGLTVLVAQITADNEQSCRFHRAAGYEPAGLLKHIGRKFGRVLDVAIYQHILD